MEVKLMEVKAGMLEMMTRSCWRKEWQEAAAKWSEKVTIVIREKSCSAYVTFPADSQDKYHLLECSTATLLPYSCNPSYFLGDAINYYKKADKNLTVIPINLAIDIFRHFVLSFSGIFSDWDVNSECLVQYLWIDDENKRHHEIIRQSLPKIYGHTVQTSSVALDRWLVVRGPRIQLGGKLRSTHYTQELLLKLRHYQTAQMIDYHFLKRGDETIKTAQNFFSRLGENLTGEIDVSAGGRHFNLINSIKKCGNINTNRQMMKMFNLDDEKDPRHNWFQVSAYPSFAALLNERLSVADVRFLVCCFIDAKYDREESLQKINAEEFPNEEDDFSDFDPLRLRGTLAMTVLSRKLKGYAIGTEEIRTGAFAAKAPTELVDIVASYYPVDILHPSLEETSTKKRKQ